MPRSILKELFLVSPETCNSCYWPKIIVLRVQVPGMVLDLCCPCRAGELVRQVKLLTCGFGVTEIVVVFLPSGFVMMRCLGSGVSGHGPEQSSSLEFCEAVHFNSQNPLVVRA